MKERILELVQGGLRPATLPKLLSPLRELSAESPSTYALLYTIVKLSDIELNSHGERGPSPDDQIHRTDDVLRKPVLDLLQAEGRAEEPEALRRLWEAFLSLGW